MRLGFLAAAVVTIALAACSREARLYPANKEAGSAALQVKFTDSGMGSGPVEVTMPDGEVLRGEFTTTDTSTYGFGTILSAAGRASAASAVSMSGSMPGVVSAIGPSGTSIRCEYLVNSLTSSGSGACQTSRGAIYNLHF